MHCNKLISKTELRVSTGKTVKYYDRTRHIECVSTKLANAMMDDNDKVSKKVVFFCDDEERADVCKTLKRIAFGVAGEE